MKHKIVVSKFGGSSMADTEAMLRSGKVTLAQNSKVVLVSATYGTTNQLVSLCKLSQQKDWRQCENILFDIKQKHHSIANELNISSDSKLLLTEQLTELETLCKGIHLLNECSDKATDRVLSIGERMSSLLFSEALKVLKPDRDVQYFDIRQVMVTDNKHTKASPLIDKIKARAKELMPLDGNVLYVTQGFIGRTVDGDTTTLGRGGSDYSASLIGEAIGADLVEIWTDVAGIATTDPRICPKAVSIGSITYSEASEMAQYGAKVLHPTTLAPAIRAGIPVFVGSSYESDKPGTWITESTDNMPIIRAITKRSEQTLLVIKTPEMLNAYGFLEKIFHVFRKHQVSVDSVTTSEISVAVTVGADTVNNEDLMQELSELGKVKADSNYSLISLIGSGIHHAQGVGQRIFTAVGDINVRMVCLGASNYNFNFLVEDKDADEAIRRLHKHFIEDDHENSSAR